MNNKKRMKSLPENYKKNSNLILNRPKNQKGRLRSVVVVHPLKSMIMMDNNKNLKRPKRLKKLSPETEINKQLKTEVIKQPRLIPKSGLGLKRKVILKLWNWK